MRARPALAALVVVIAATACGGSSSPSADAVDPPQASETAGTGAVPGSPSASAPAAEPVGGGPVSVRARDYQFIGLTDFTAKAGDKVTFTMKNISPDRQHDFVISGPDGKEVGGVGIIGPESEESAEVTLARAGVYTYVCTVGNHEEKGMKGTFTVS